jgi:REP element-mobilizing transposase RayT
VAVLWRARLIHLFPAEDGGERQFAATRWSLTNRLCLTTLATMKSAPLTPQPEWHHLPRLAPEFYHGFAAVFWTITLERRATGWLDDSFHQHFRELLLHAAAREGLYCPTYVLMPDHLHLVWLGLRAATDQLRAVRFLRKYVQREFTRRSPPSVEFELQKQAHDEVLKEQDCTHGALAKACFYVMDNPRRKGLVERPRDWQHLGAVVPGFPFLHPVEDDFWPLFWKLYQEHREPTPSL